MKTEINLLQQKQSSQKKRSAFFKLCLFLLLLTITITIGEIAYTYFLRTRLSSLALDQSATLSQIETLEAKRVKFQTLKERLVSIGEILPESKKFNARIQSIFNSLPSSAEISNIEATPKDISITISSASLATINNFLNEGVDSIIANKATGVTSATVSQVGIVEDVGYSAQVKFVF